MIIRKKKKLPSQQVFIPKACTVENIKALLKDLDENNTASTKNFLRLFLRTPVQNSKHFGTIKKANEYAEELKENATSAELKFKELLDKLEVQYVFQHPIFYERTKFYILDFYIPSRRICFEVDGGYHLDATQTKKDKDRDVTLKTYLHIETVRITNKEVFSKECEKIIKDGLKGKIIRNI